MKKNRTGSKTSLTSNINKKNPVNINLVLALLFVISALYFLFPGNYILFYQENLFLFIFSGEYLSEFASKPGGLLEYAGNFLTQGYFNSIYGTIIISGLFILIALVYLKIVRQLSPDRSFSFSLAIIPSCLLILMQTNINWLIHNNIGILLVALYFYHSIKKYSKPAKIVIIALFPLFYYITGAFAWLFLIMFILYSLIYDKWIYTAIFSAVAVLTFFIFMEIIFLQSSKSLLLYHLPSKEIFNHTVILYLSGILFVLYPLIIKFCYYIATRIRKISALSFYPSLVILSLTIFVLSKLYNPEVDHSFRLESLIHQQKWKEAIILQEKYRLKNLIAQFYYNVALSEVGLLSERMFYGPQDYGTNSIIIPWNAQAGINTIFRGVYFYYSIGLVNEVHRWAFESMVVQGYRPENIKLLIKTNLIMGRYEIADKYIYILKKSLHYRKLALKYERISGNPGLIDSDPELSNKRRLQPKGDFNIRIKNPQSNILLILKEDQGNEKAFEYKLAWYLLEKSVPDVVNEIKSMKSAGYKRVPRHVEEAAMAYIASVGPLPDLGEMVISKETQNRFSQFESALSLYNVNAGAAKNAIEIAGINTYWLYLDKQQK